MNNFEKRLFTHILNAKVEPTLLQIAPQEDVDVGPIQDTEEMGPDYRLQTLFDVLKLVIPPIFFWAVWTLVKGLLDMRSDKCSEAALKAIRKAINYHKNKPLYLGSSPAEQAAQLIAIFQDILNEIGGDCKKKFLALPEVHQIARDIGVVVGETVDKILTKYLVPGGLIAYAKRLLEIGSQGAAIRLWLYANNYNFSASEVAWIAGLSVAGIIALGVAIAAAGGALDLTVWGAPAGVALNVVGVGIVALGIWLYNNQPPDNTV
jgi:hypothetical protein